MVMWDTWEHTEHARNARAGVDRASGFMSETACTHDGLVCLTARRESEAARRAGLSTQGGLIGGVEGI